MTVYRWMKKYGAEWEKSRQKRLEEMGVKPKTVLPIVEPKSEKSPEEKAEEEHLARQEAERVEEEQKKRREAEIERERVVEEIKQKWLGENRRCAPGELNREVEERLKGGN